MLLAEIIVVVVVAIAIIVVVVVAIVLAYHFITENHSIIMACVV
jgi:nitrate reductase NapE component